MNDLIGLEYGWGHRPGDGSGKTDCFQLACEVRRRLGMSDYAARFAWVYERFTEAEFCRTQLVRWVRQNSDRCHAPRPGAVLLLPSQGGSALGTWLDGFAIFIGPGSHVVQASLPLGAARYFWMKP